MSPLISLLEDAGDRDDEILRLGQKGAWLRWLAAQGERVPEGFIVPVEMAKALRDRDPTCVAELEAALSALRGKGNALAVRASPVYSLPGALLTVLDLTVAGDLAALVARVLEAIDRVLLSASSSAACNQLAAQSAEPLRTPWLAVIVQVMINVKNIDDFGAVAFTHDPARGELGLVGEYAPGQATAVVVSGRARPEPLARAGSRPGRENTCLEVAQPQAFQRVSELSARLANAADEPLDLELVMASGELWIVQARPLVLSVRAALRVALEAARGKRASLSRLLRRITAKDLASLVEARLPEPAQLSNTKILARGLAASPGVASGRLVFELDDAIARAALEPVVLVRRDALPDDIAAFRAARAIITTSGGLTSHAAVIARGLRVPAAIGCADLRIDVKSRCLVGTTELGATEVIARENDRVTVDGHRGIVYAGALPSVPVVAPELRALCNELRSHRRTSLLALGPSIAADRAYEECALDGIWDAQTATDVRGSATASHVHIAADFATDALSVGQPIHAAIACPPEHAPAWVLWLASQVE